MVCLLACYYCSITDGLFRETVLSETQNVKYKDVVVEEQLVDSMVYVCSYSDASYIVR